MNNELLENLKRHHLALRRRANGKIASRKDQARRAAELEAQRLTDIGEGGGIVPLLLPTSLRRRAENNAIREIYEVVRVIARLGTRKATADRTALIAAVADDDLICELAVSYAIHIRSNAGPHTRSAKAFTRWLKRELQNRTSEAYLVVRRRAPMLLDVERGDRWWADALSTRRKMRS